MKRAISTVLSLSILLIPISLYAEGADYGVAVSSKFGNGLKNVLSSPLIKATKKFI